MRSYGSHAIVVGASMAGMLAARALSGPYARVTVLDRDELPADGATRKGVPQGRHLHVLLSRGAELLDEMFPGLLDQLEAAGVPVVRQFEQAMFNVGGHDFRFPSGPVTPPLYAPSRPFLESQVRARLRALPGVEMLEHAEATALLSTPGGDRVTGVRVYRGGAESELAADLVVDCTGRTGRAPVWLRELGYPTPPEEQLAIDLLYATRNLRAAPGALGPKLIGLIGPVPGNARGLGFAHVEGGVLVVTIAGYGGDHPPTDDAGFDAYVASIAPPAMAAAFATRSLGPVVTHRYPANLRRRYEKLDRFPAGFLVFGDAFCSFNPLYGQGMTVSALQARALRRCLVRGKGGPDDLAPRFFKAAAKPVDVAWQFALGGDLSLPEVAGERSLQVRVLNGYVAKVQAAAEHDPVVAETFLRVVGFLLPPTALFAPDILRRVLRRGSPTPAAPPTPPPPAADAPAPAAEAVPVDVPELPTLQGVEPT